MGEGAAAMSQDEREEPMSDDVTSSDQTPQEIEHEIERTRERMSSNIDALGERLSPDNLKQQAKEAIAGKAQDMVANVGDQARLTGGRVIDFITENPLPVAAVGLGAIWLFSMRRGSRSEVSGDRMARFAYTGPERRQPDGRPGLGRRLVDGADSVRHTVGDAASHAGQRLGELKDRAEERAGQLGGTARARARDAKGGARRMLQKNPLALAAGAVVLGVALGMLLPESEPENRLMGETRDELGDRISNVASRVKDAAIEAGRDVKETVREEIDQRAPEVTSTLREAAEHVKDQIKDSATAVAQEAKDEVKRPPAGRKR
jgi:gas vesicle protein